MVFDRNLLFDGEYTIKKIAKLKKYWRNHGLEKSVFLSDRLSAYAANGKQALKRGEPPRVDISRHDRVCSLAAKKIGLLWKQNQFQSDSEKENCNNRAKLLLRDFIHDFLRNLRSNE